MTNIKAAHLFSSLRLLLASLCVLMAPAMARAQNYSDIWFNPAESGWGLTIADHQSNLFAVWFTYRQDGKATWYVIPGGTFSNGHKHFRGDIYAATGPAYSAATFDPATSGSTPTNPVGASRWPSTATTSSASGSRTTPTGSRSRMAEYYDQVIKPRLQSASGSCSNAVSAMDSLNTFTRIRSTAGIFDDIPNYLADLDTVRLAFNKLVVNTPCYFEETATFQTVGAAGFVNADIKAKWKVASQSGNVLKYVPFDGHLNVDYPTLPPCAVTNPVHGLARGDGELTVDWDARTYTGAAMHNTTLNITCPPPNAESRDTPFPVMYLGDLGNPPTGTSSGRINAANGITRESRAFGPMIVTYEFTKSCSGANAIFCGNVIPLP